MTKCEDDLVDALSQLAFNTTAALTALAGEYDLTLPQMRVLGILRGRRVRMTDLAQHLGLERSSLSGLVDRAEKRGLVRRDRDDNDGRSIVVLLTEVGEDLSERATSRARDLVLPIVGALDPTERATLSGLLAKASRDAVSDT